MKRYATRAIICEEERQRRLQISNAKRAQNPIVQANKAHMRALSAQWHAIPLQQRLSQYGNRFNLYIKEKKGFRRK